MTINLDLTYDAQDDLFTAILFEGYECCYYCYREDVQKYHSDPTRYEFKREDINDYIRTLGAYETLAKHYSKSPQNTEKLLQAIRDRIDYKYKISKGMSQ